MVRLPPRSTLFPYTRSSDLVGNADFVINGAQMVLDGLFGDCELSRDFAIPPALHQATNDGFLPAGDRKSTRLNSSHRCISYAVFCLKKKKSFPSIRLFLTIM